MNEPKTATWGNMIISGASSELAHQALGDHSTVAARARQAAENADGVAYADVVSEYATLGVGRTAARKRSFSRYFGSRSYSDLDQK
ncbi:hypothetical protein ACIA8E_28895 [Streptomyces sp. NPDC051664]|uniref:hypothetical protein n=1 Tax=Streptomyces sp. NPDC051664 TaxID=3365668 RepID=UPI0037BA9390